MSGFLERNPLWFLWQQVWDRREGRLCSVAMPVSRHIRRFEGSNPPPSSSFHRRYLWELLQRSSQNGIIYPFFPLSFSLSLSKDVFDRRVNNDSMLETGVGERHYYTVSRDYQKQAQDELSVFEGEIARIIDNTHGGEKEYATDNFGRILFWKYTSFKPEESIVYSKRSSFHHRHLLCQCQRTRRMASRWCSFSSRQTLGHAAAQLLEQLLLVCGGRGRRWVPSFLSTSFHTTACCTGKRSLRM